MYIITLSLKSSSQRHKKTFQTVFFECLTTGKIGYKNYANYFKLGYEMRNIVIKGAKLLEGSLTDLK